MQVSTEFDETDLDDLDRQTDTVADNITESMRTLCRQGQDDE